MKKRILISSNIIFFRNSLANLSKDFYETQMAADGKETLNSLFEFKPHIVFMDCTYPDIDSIEVLRKIKKHNPHIVVCFFVGSLNKTETIKAKEMGVQEICRKPLQNVTITQILRKIPNSYGELLEESEKHYNSNYSDNLSEVTFELDEPDVETDLSQSIVETDVNDNEDTLVQDEDNLSESEKQVRFEISPKEDLTEDKDVNFINKELDKEVVIEENFPDKDNNVLFEIKNDLTEKDEEIVSNELEKDLTIIEEAFLLNDEEQSLKNEKDDIMLTAQEDNGFLPTQEEIVAANIYIKEEFEKLLSIHNKTTLNTLKQTEENLSKTLKENIDSANKYEKSIDSKLDEIMLKFKNNNLEDSSKNTNNLLNDLQINIENSFRSIFNEYNNIFADLLKNILNENKLLKEEIINEIKLINKSTVSYSKEPLPVETPIEIDRSNELEPQEIISIVGNEYNHHNTPKKEKEPIVENTNQGISFEFHEPTEDSQTESIPETKVNHFIPPPRPSDYNVLKKNNNYDDEFEENDISLIHFEDDEDVEYEEEKTSLGFNKLKSLFGKK